MIKKTVMAVSILMAFICMTVNAAEKYELVRQGNTGESVQRIQLRLRDLDFLHFKPTGSFRAMTVSATIAFQRVQVDDNGNWMAADGDAGEQTQSVLFSTRARRASIPQNVSMPIGPSLRGTPTIKGDLISWDKVKEQLKLGGTYKLYDYNTGKSLTVQYVGGENHAEVECVSAQDTATFLEIFGNEYNFSKRPVVLQLNADSYIAASLFGSPHGTDSIGSNDMDGHTCLFFDGSRSNVGQVTDVEHQKQIYAAAGM